LDYDADEGYEYCAVAEDEHCWGPFSFGRRSSSSSMVWQCVFLLVSVSLVERGVIAYGVWGYAAGGKTLKEDSPQSTGGSISFANSINALPIFLASCAEKYMVNRRSQGSIMMISAYASTRSVQSVVSHLSLKVCISLDSSLVSLFGYYLEVVLVHVVRFML
jgi:hypothetical protein